MNDAISQPPIASPHGVGTSHDQFAAPIEEIELVVPIHLSFARAFRSACIELLHPGRLCGFTYFLGLGSFLAIFLSPIRPSIQIIFPPTFLSLYELQVLLFVGYGLFIAVIYAFWMSVFTCRSEVEIEKDGVHIYYLDRNFNYLDRKFVLPWSKIRRVICFDSNVWVTSSVKCFLIPRESFASPTQVQAFASALRQIWNNKRTT